MGISSERIQRKTLANSVCKQKPHITPPPMYLFLCNTAPEGHMALQCHSACEMCHSEVTEIQTYIIIIIIIIIIVIICKFFIIYVLANQSQFQLDNSS